MRPHLWVVLHRCSSLGLPFVVTGDRGNPGGTSYTTVSRAGGGQRKGLPVAALSAGRNVFPRGLQAPPVKYH